MPTASFGRAAQTRVCERYRGKVGIWQQDDKCRRQEKMNINQEPETNEGDIVDTDKNVESEQQHKAKTRDETEIKKTKRRKKG